MKSKKRKAMQQEKAYKKTAAYLQNGTNSKYAKKIIRQKKVIFSPNSPFKAIQEG